MLHAYIINTRRDSGKQDFVQRIDLPEYGKKHGEFGGGKDAHSCPTVLIRHGFTGADGCFVVSIHQFSELVRQCICPINSVFNV